MKEILYTTAKLKNNEIINIKDAQKNQLYYCVTCNKQMILKKSDKQIRRPHFSHKSLITNCTPEGVLHKSFKSILFKKIENKLKYNKSIEIEWLCKFCNKKHNVNLLSKTKKVKLEAHLRDCKPDILLFDKNNNPIIAIEVIVTHSPNEKTLKYLRDNNIVLLKFNIKNEEDLKEIQKDNINPSSVLCCLNNPRCTKCNSFMQYSKGIISNAPCWKCNSPMKIANFDTDRNDNLDKEEFLFLKKNGVYIEKRYVNHLGRYNVNVCKTCNYFVGPFMKLDYFYDNYKLENYLLGYSCPNCNYYKKNKENEIYFIK